MIEADSFLLHRKSKTPPEKGGVFTSLDGLRRFWTLSQLNKYTSQGDQAPIWTLQAESEETLWERACSRMRFDSQSDVD
ncbi:hypothetical protein EYC95_13160 [Pseudomonas sp. BGI-2]|nr:hypothetical protein EYC95_13160 [Pseudomonas sp. BGI-2]